MNHVAAIKDPVFAGKSAKKWASDLLSREHRGPDDTIEAAAYRLQTRLGVDASIILQGWNRPARDMKVSRWLPLFMAWAAEFPDRLYEDERKRHDPTSKIARLADFVAGEGNRREPG